MVGPAVQGNAIPGFGRKLKGQHKKASCRHSDIPCWRALWTGPGHALPCGRKPFLKHAIRLP